MTNQEAIETLKTNYPDACYEQLREAVDTAISALQAQYVPDTNAGDTISRQAAIDIADDLRACISVDGYWAWTERLKKLPSAQQWIPIEDRQPEFGKDVLISHRGFVSIDWLTQSEGNAYFFASRLAIADIDAWMPLPSSFREGGEV